MPVQAAPDKFIRFTYNPDYLLSKKWQATITDTGMVCRKIGIGVVQSDIVLDGGNLIRNGNRAIICDKIFKENPHYTRSALAAELKKLLDVGSICFIPKQPYDYTGHADGMVRFVDTDTVLINSYQQKSGRFKTAFKKALNQAGLNFIEIPCNPYHNKYYIQANVIYINYLQLQSIIILPTFGIPDDDLAVKQFEKLFPKFTIATIDGNAIANEGGILNCISWDINR